MPESELEFFSTSAELEQPLHEQDYGETRLGKLVGRIADRSIGFPVRKVFDNLKLTIPPEIDLYERFEIWMVPNRINVFRQGGVAEVVSVGLECEFENPTGGTLCVIELLPGPAFVTYGVAKGNLLCRANLSASGEISIPVPQMASSTSPPQTFAKEGLQFETQSGVQLGASFSFSVATPYVHAIGVGSSRVQWRFDRKDEVLFGRDIAMWTVIALPKGVRELIYKARMFLRCRTFFFPTQMESKWEQITCQLES